jgi:hypothetical protein
MALICDKMIAQVSTAKAGPRQTILGHMISIKNASSNASWKSITEQDMLNGYCSILATLSEEGTAAARTMLVNHAAVTGVALSYDVNGNATENYTLTSDNKTWFLNDWANVRCYKATRWNLFRSPSAYSARGLAFQFLSSAIPETSSVVALGINGNLYRLRTGFGTTGNMSVHTASGASMNAVKYGKFVATSYAWATPGAVGGVSSAGSSTDRFWIYYKAPGSRLWEASASNAAQPGYEFESTAGAIGALRRGQIKAYLYNTLTGTKATYTAAGRALRLQTVSIDVALGEEQLLELGTEGFYGIVKQTPVPITVTVSANDSDLEYFSTLVSTAHSTTTVKTLNAADFNGYNALRIDIYKEPSQTTLLKTITCTKMQVQSEGFNVAVGGLATQELTFTTDNITVVGSGVNTTGGFYGAL